jgi:alkylhydroperoxidase/carboxymuconolactone decarboxylase family protein YurZ
MSSALTEREAALKARFIQIHGLWEPRWLSVLTMDADFFERYLVFAAAAQVETVLDAKTRQLILLAVNVQTTTLHEPGIRAHIDGALLAGATQAELIEVLQLVCLLGVHSLIVGLPIMLDEFAKAGQPVDLESELTPRQAEAKANFIHRRGYWSDRGNPLLILDADYFEAYSDLSVVPWERAAIAPKLKELIYIAIDAATTHLYETGLRLHIQNAIRQGATAAEVTAVLQLISSHGMNSCTVGMPIVQEAFERTGR